MNPAMIQLAARVTRLETQIAPFWAVMESIALDVLHHPDLPDRDRLIEKYQHGELTNDEAATFLGMLKKTIADPQARGVDKAAAMWLAAIVSAKIVNDAPLQVTQLSEEQKAKLI